MKVSVGSWSWVTAWKIDTSRPTTRLTPEDRQRELERDPHRLRADLHDLALVHGARLTGRSRATSDSDTRCQPSTSTNSRILNGREMTTGGSITMPMLITVDAMTMSMMRNGIRIRKPISNAVFSSESTKAGMSTRVGHVGAGLRAARSSDRSVKSARSFWSTCLNMKSRIGTSARLSAVSSSIFLSISGWRAVSLIAVKVGAITNMAQEQRDAHEHLVGRHRGRAEGVPHEAEHDDDPGEAGHHDQDRRGQAQHREQRQQLERGRDLAVLAVEVQVDARARPTPTAGHRMQAERQDERGAGRSRAAAMRRRRVVAGGGRAATMRSRRRRAAAPGPRRRGAVRSGASLAGGHGAQALDAPTRRPAVVCARARSAAPGSPAGRTSGCGRGRRRRGSRAASVVGADARDRR